MKAPAFVLACAFAFVHTNARAAEPAGAKVHVVGALHSLHERAQGFSYSALQQLIEAADPDVLLVETRPDELAERMETPGRPEYPRVVWAYLAANPNVKAIAMEPDRAVFDVWVGEASAAMSAVEKQAPDAYAYWDSYETSLALLLTAHWTSPANAHDALTADMARAWYHVHGAVLGDELKAGQTRWDGYMVEQAQQAVRRNPDARIVVLGSYRNRHLFEDALRAVAPTRVVDMETWLRERE